MPRPHHIEKQVRIAPQRAWIETGAELNSIDQRLERLRARVAGRPKPSIPRRVPPAGVRCFCVTSGNVTVLFSETDQSAAMKAFGELMALGPPFEDSALGEIMQIKDMRTDMTWYASTMACLSATHP